MNRRPLSIAAAALLLALPLLPVPDFWITQLNYIGLFSLVVLGLVLLTGVGGLTSFGQAAFAGVGAYATGYLTTVLGLSPWLGLVAGLGLTLVLALVIGMLTLRMSGHYLPLATICWCLALYYLVGNLDALGKYDGLLGLPAITLGDISFQSERRIYALIWLAALAAAVAVTRLLDSRPGRIMRALNTNRGGGATMPEAMGASTFRHKLVMFVVAALLASVSGWLYAHMQRSVNPSPFGIKFGIEYLFMAVLGGIGTVGGASPARRSSSWPRTSSRSGCRWCSAARATTRSSCLASCWCWCCALRPRACGRRCRGGWRAGCPPRPGGWWTSTQRG